MYFKIKVKSFIGKLTKPPKKTDTDMQYNRSKIL